jgi:hypothetical protein
VFDRIEHYKFSKIVLHFQNRPNRRFPNKQRRDRGDMGLIPVGRLEGVLDRVAFSLRVGEISEVIATDQGFHILQRYA